MFISVRGGDGISKTAIEQKMTAKGLKEQMKVPLHSKEKVPLIYYADDE